jgi:hypothetical protein
MTGPLGPWNGEDYADEQNLTRLYERRTWEMFVLITEARKHQRYNGAYYSGDELLDETSPHPDGPYDGKKVDPGTIVMSPSHEMIFSCDLD